MGFQVVYRIVVRQMAGRERENADYRHQVVQTVVPRSRVDRRIAAAHRRVIQTDWARARCTVDQNYSGAVENRWN